MKSDLLFRLTARLIGDGKPECGTFAFYGFRPNLSAQLVDNGLRDGESQSRPALFFVQFHKPVEDMWQFIGRNTCAGILYIKVNLCVLNFISDTDCAFVREFNRIGYKIREHLSDTVAVG